jgi:hypothetical protein
MLQTKKYIHNYLCGYSFLPLKSYEGCITFYNPTAFDKAPCSVYNLLQPSATFSLFCSDQTTPI